jgi:hypothetical protein
MKIFWLLPFTAVAQISSTCFFSSYGPYGVAHGTNFTDLAILTSNQVSPDMLISKAFVCTDSKSGTIHGLQMSLTSPKTGTTTKLSAIGASDDLATTCYVFEVDVKNDFLLSVKIGYNSTGIYALQFTTFLNRSAAFGQDMNNALLSKTGLTLRTEGPKFEIMGFMGT